MHTKRHKKSRFHYKSTFKMHSGNSVEFQKNQNSFDMQFNREIVCHPNSWGGKDSIINDISSIQFSL